MEKSVGKQQGKPLSKTAAPADEHSPLPEFGEGRRPQVAGVGSHLSHFDRVVAVVIVGLLLLIVGTIALGDRVGVQIVTVAPQAEAHSTSPIMLRFSEVMDHDSVAAHFQTDPAIEGTLAWNGSTLSFHPTAALQPGSTYTVKVDAGAVSASGRQVLDEYQHSFSVMLPRIAYLYPADDAPHNIWITDPLHPDQAKQITDSPTGIDDYSVSPDGTKLAFVEANPANDTGAATSDIKLIDLASGALEQVTNCSNAVCTAPVWRPDGKVIAYERTEYDAQFGSGPPRIWLIDLTTKPATTRPLFQETQILGYDAQWSGDGNRIALVDSASVSILVYDFSTGKIISIASQAGESGALSPDGTRLIYPDIVFQPEGAFTKQRLAVLDSGDFLSLTDQDAPISDRQARWSPDGTKIALARENQNSPVRGIQIALYDLRTDQTTMLTNDSHYANLSFWWSPTGEQLAIQRVPELDNNLQPNSDALPEIWTYDLSSGALNQVTTNAYLPRWIP